MLVLLPQNWRGGDSLKLKEAQEYANKIVALLKPVCREIVIVGSIRRMRPEVNDVDIVLIPDSSHYNWKNWFNQTEALVMVSPPETWRKTIPQILLSPDCELRLAKEIGGPWLMRFVSETVTVDLYRATEDNWGTLMLVRTGSKEHNIKLCEIARAKGLKLSASEGVIDGNKIIASKTEDEIFAALGLSYSLPEDREVPQ
jgi:DNA polymerase (family 10)